MIQKEQMPKLFKDIIDDEVSIYGESPSITQESRIPDTKNIPIENKTHWKKIPDVICVYVDMMGSTKLSAQKFDKVTAKIYRLFTSTATRIFHDFESSYIDIKGDGVFALFNSNEVHRALSAAVTFNTFIQCVFVDKVKSDYSIEIGCHIGIDQKTVLVRKLGLKKVEGRTDRQNEVWAGKPINMAAKLASISLTGEIIVSDRFFKNIKSDKALRSCGCPNGTKVSLWDEESISDDRFDFNTIYKLKNYWCKTHGSEYCTDLMNFD